MIVAEHAAETLSAHDTAAHGGVVVHRRDEVVAKTLVRAFSVIVRDELMNNLAEVALAQRDDARETLATY